MNEREYAEAAHLRAVKITKIDEQLRKLKLKYNNDRYHPEYQSQAEPLVLVRGGLSSEQYIERKGFRRTHPQRGSQRLRGSNGI